MSATRAASRRTSQSAMPRWSFVMKAIGKAGYKAGERRLLALDCASTEFFKDGSLRLWRREQDPLDSEQVQVPRRPRRAIPIVSIEDGMSEDDMEGWKELTDRSAPSASWSATICSSPTSRGCADGIKKGRGNSILVKVNQIGTLTETLEAVEMATRPATPP
jgi:enolase